MLLISHRGNISGRNPERENSPEYIDEAIKRGYTVEIDLTWYPEGLYLAHDYRCEKHFIDLSFLYQRKSKLLIHMKNLWDSENFTTHGYNCFYHLDDPFVISSKGWIISHSEQGAKKGTICMLPEIHGLSKDAVTQCAGVCSDIISFYK